MSRKLIKTIVYLIFTGSLFLAGEGCTQLNNNPTAFPPPNGNEWGNKLWTHRRSFTVNGVNTVIKQLPLSIPLSKIIEKSQMKSISLASFRIVGPEGEIPCQIDEFDNTEGIKKNPNHLPDDNDQLVFQVDVPAVGKTKYWIYWSTSPLPLGKYPVETMVHHVVEPGFFKGDMMMHNRRSMLAVQGPSRHEDPTKNTSENWGGGSIVFCEIDRFPIVRGGWANYIPRGGVSTNPCQAATLWSLPEILVNGPVRTGIQAQNPKAELKHRKDIVSTCKAERRYWLFESDAWIVFDEVLTVPKKIEKFSFRYEINLRFGNHPGDQIAYSTKNILETFSPTEEQITQAEKAMKIAFSKSGLDPWLAGWSKERENGCAIIAIPQNILKGEKQQASFYCRRQTYFRLSRSFTGADAGDKIKTRFWIMGLKNQDHEKAAMAAYQFFVGQKWSLGPVETPEVK